VNDKLNRLLDHLETFLPTPLMEQDWKNAKAFRWQKRDSIFGSIGFLKPVKHLSDISFNDLKHIDRQRDAIIENTQHFVQKRPANNILLTGARGGESGYKAMKSALDGSISAQVDNILIYATSNRRHLLPEYMSDNESYVHTEDGEIHPGEVVEEKISLSERFGLWLSFYPPRQEEYLAIVSHWLSHFGLNPKEIEAARSEALVWALERGSRSGRVAWQFAKYWAGSHTSKK